MRLFTLFFLLLAPLGLLLAPLGRIASATPPLPSAALADHVDSRLGFRIAPPRGWTPIPPKVDERWMVAKYLADKSDFWTDKELGWTNEFRAEMRVTAFPHEQKKSEVVAAEEGITVVLENPFKDYKDYMTRAYSGGGWFVNKEEESKLGDLKVTKLEIRVEKSSNEGPKRVTTWIYHVPDFDVAVHFECLENGYAKLAGAIDGSLKSFKAIPRTESGVESSGQVRLTLRDFGKLDPEKRKLEKAKLEKEAHDKVIASPVEGWTTKKYGRYLVVNHTDEKYAKRVVEQIDGLMQWLGETFPYVGPGEYVRAPIVRICKDFDEFKSYYVDGDLNWSNIEVFTFQDYGGATSSATEFLNKIVTQRWFLDRDPKTFYALPPWLAVGLYFSLGQAEVKGGKLTIGRDDWFREKVREAVRNDTVTPARKLMEMPVIEEPKFAYESTALVNYLLRGPGSKDKRTKDVLQNYVKAITQIAAELEKQDEADRASKKGDEAPQTEEEEDAQFKQNKQRWKERSKKIADEAIARVFKDWSAADWKAFEDSFLQSLK